MQDFIIVGAGSSGCALAARLGSEAEAWGLLSRDAGATQAGKPLESHAAEVRGLLLRAVRELASTVEDPVASAAVLEQTLSLPRAPSAPARLSITTGCANTLLNCCITMRACRSTGPPGGKPTITRNGRFG